MTDYTWAEQRDRFIAACNGETPVSRQLEQTIIDVFEQQPALVVRAIDQVAASFAAGKVQSGWAVLRAHVERAAQPARDATANDNSDRTKKISQTEQWMRTCGIHFDRDSEIQDELFCSRGLLYPWRDDLVLRSRILSLWRQLRPVGEQHERDEADRAAQWVKSHTCERCGNVYPFAKGCGCKKKLEEIQELLRRNDVEPQLDPPEPPLNDRPEPVLT